jgi:hypothetical protein
MRITFSAGESEQCEPCQYSLVWNDDGVVYYQYTDIDNRLITTPLQDEACCDGYWLPLQKQCPTIATMTFQLDGTILSNGQPLSPECCTDEITQYRGVYHDGRNCRWGTGDEGQITQCDRLQLAITTNGVVIDSATGQSIPQECCTKTVVGNEVVWDGRQCLAQSPNPDSPTDTQITEQVTLRLAAPSEQEEYNVFDTVKPDGTPQTPDGTLPEQQTNPAESYYCWWCPPSDQLSTVCSPEEFITTLNLTEEEFIIKAQGYGFKGTTYDQAITFMTQIMSNFFSKGRCILMVTSTGEVLKNSKCCTNRGGTWDAENKLCIEIQQVECDPLSIRESYNNTTIVVDVSGKIPVVLNQSCCESFGYTWSSTNITVTETDGTVTTFNDLATQQTLQELGHKGNFCSICPTELFITKDQLVTDVSGESLNQKCCEIYGYNYVEGVGCKKCNPANIIVTADNKEILNTDGSVVSESCCEAYNGYWDTGNLAGTKTFSCWYCPQTFILADEVINGVGYLTIKDGSGNKLSNICCTYYGDKTGQNVSWNDTVGCYRSQQEQQLQELSPVR